jgi:hypothetical protein
MTDIIDQNTDTVEGILALLRGRLARGVSPHQTGDSFPFAAFLVAMNTLHDEALDQDMLALCVKKLKAGQEVDSAAALSGFTRQYIDAAYRVINRESDQA